MTTSADISLVIPVLPGKAEAWRRFIQEVQGPKNQEWTGWQARVGLETYQSTLQETPQWPVVLVRARIVRENGRPLIDRYHPFDRWLREQVLALHGIDLEQCQETIIPPTSQSFQPGE